MMGPGTSIAADLGEGLVDRIRSLPTSRSAYLFGHFAAELAAALLAVGILCASGFAIGWSVDTSAPYVIGGLALLVAFASATIWLGTLLGVVARTPDAVQGLVFMTVFPMTFLSNVFVPASELPDGLRQIAEWNPVSAAVAALRTLFGNPVAAPANPPWPLEHPVLAAILWTGLFLALSIPLTVRRFNTRTTE
jgi:ABC-2 type transport system permease protein